MKEYWINVYGPDHELTLYWHETREAAIARQKVNQRPIYRIHVKLKCWS